MKKILAIAFSAFLPLMAGAQKTTVDIHDVAVKVTEKGLGGMDLGHYMGTCLYHGMADLAIATGDPKDMERVMKIMNMFTTGELKATFFNSYSYYVGGQAMPFLAWKGQSQLAPLASKYADIMWKEQARTSDNIMTANNQKNPAKKDRDGFWIDMAFTITPYMLYSGLLMKNQEYIDYSAFEILKMYEILYDKESNGLFHQARAINNLAKGEISQDCWSRGNGWGSMAFGSELLYYPKNGKYYKELRKQAKKFYEAAVRYQTPEGMWCQEMTNLQSYPEISGSAQILAGLGAAIESGVLSKKKYMPAFEKGLKAVLSYVDPDGSVGHCCMGNLAPGKATKKEYEVRHFYYNEQHAFGPVVLALAQAIRLGYKNVTLDAKLGSANDKDRPRTYCKFVTERKEDFAWENDFIAFRVYSRAFVPNRKASGVDLWPKSVDYSIIDKRYDENRRKISYHKDHGEGCDFYNMGNARGIGGTAFWLDGVPVLTEQYTNWRIWSNSPEHIDFQLDFQPLKVGDDLVYDSKRIEMVLGTPFYKVTETIESASGKDVTLAIGLTNFGAAKVEKFKEKGLLSLSESYKHKGEVIGVSQNPPLAESLVNCGVIVNPDQLVDFVKNETDEYVLVKVKSGVPVVYYVGAHWDQNRNTSYLSGYKYWQKRVIEESTWNSLNAIYSK